MNVNQNLNLMMPHTPTPAALGALGVRRCSSHRALYSRAEEGPLNALRQWRMITQHTTREGRGWRESEEA